MLMISFTIWSQWAHGNLRNWAEDHGLDSMAEERPFAKNCAEKNTELLERSEVSKGEIDYYMELYMEYIWNYYMTIYIYMELELNYYIWIYIWNISPYSSIYMELELYCLEIYWWSTDPCQLIHENIAEKTAWYFLKGFSSSIVRVPTVTAQLYTAKVELRSLRCKT